jgi:hypothetical protein
MGEMRRFRPFAGSAALVAYERDGKPLDDFRVVMPGAWWPRKVRDLISIKIE